MNNINGKDQATSSKNNPHKANIVSFWKFNNKLGISKLLYGVDYQRCLEYPVAFNNLRVDETVSGYLDVGTGKYSIFPLYVAFQYPHLKTKLTDINGHVFKQLNFINKIKKLKTLHKQGYISIEKQDARSLTYEDDSFDRVSAISSIEHIPEDGDSMAVREIMRVLKPNGVAVITVPYKHAGYEARFKKQSAKALENDEKPEFFSHYYDEKALYERLINTGDYIIQSITYLGETDFHYFDFWTSKVPVRNTIKYFLGWLHPIIALKYYKILEEKDKSNAHVAIITLSKR